MKTTLLFVVILAISIRPWAHAGEEPKPANPQAETAEEYGRCDDGREQLCEWRALHGGSFRRSDASVQRSHPEYAPPTGDAPCPDRISGAAD